MIYVSADLHGCDPLDFQRLLDRAGFRQKDYLFILGDVIDRGEHGAQLLLWLTQQPNIQLILGNHEALMLACRFLFQLADDTNLDALSTKEIELVQCWVDNGGGPTMKGLGRLLREEPELFEGIMEYLQEAPYYEELEVGGRRFVLVHGGLGNFHPARSLEDYTPQELLLERPSLQTRYYSDATVIFGHTPTVLFGQQYAGRALKTDSWVCIDTGAACGYGPMVLRLDDMKEFY